MQKRSVLKGVRVIRVVLSKVVSTCVVEDGVSGDMSKGVSNGASEGVFKGVVHGVFCCV